MKTHEIAVSLRMLAGGNISVCFAGNSPVYEAVCERLEGSGAALCIEPDKLVNFHSLVAQHGLPKAVFVSRHGLFALGHDSLEAHANAALFTGCTVRLSLVDGKPAVTVPGGAAWPAS